MLWLRQNMDFCGFTLKNLSVIFSLLAVLIKDACGIQCYECSTLIDKRCGITWNVPKEDFVHYLVDCSGPTQSCVKYVSEIYGHSNQEVYRYCRNSSMLDKYKPIYCEPDEIRGSTFCQCASHACNRQSRLEAYASFIVVATFFFNILLF